MSYCTQSDIEEQLDAAVLVQLTDDAGAGVVASAVVQRAIDDADAEIDAYCSSRYETPFAAVPAIIRKLSVDMAAYHLYARRHGAPPERQTRYDAAVRLLKDVSRGAVSIGAAGVPPVSAGAAGAMSSRSASDRVFSDSSLAGY